MRACPIVSPDLLNLFVLDIILETLHLQNQVPPSFDSKNSSSLSELSSQSKSIDGYEAETGITDQAHGQQS